MKRRLILPVILLSLAVLSGCGKKTEAPEDGQTEVEEVKEPPAPGEENWGTAPDFTAPMITSTPVRSLSVNVGRTEEEVNLTWFSPAEEAGQVYWTTAEDTEFEKAVTFEASVSASEVTTGYYVNRATVTRSEEHTSELQSQR